MNRLLTIVLGFIAVITIAVTAVFMLTGGMVKDTKAFFIALKNDDTAKVSSYLSTAFTDNTSIEELKSFFDSSSLADYKDSTWNSRSFQNNTGEIKGTVKTESGQTIPLTVSFVKEAGKWKISAIDIKKAGLSSEIVNAPSSEEQIKLVNNSMSAFIDSLESQSMEGFHNYISQILKKQKDLKGLEEIFSDYYPNAEDFRNTINNASPVFTQKGFINEDSELIIEGYYPNGDNKLEFEHAYVREGSTWKLSGFFFEIVTANVDSLPIPSEEEQVELVVASMKAFSSSLDKQSMEDFRNYVSEFWRKAQDIEVFEGNFAVVYSNAEDFRNTINNASPVFKKEAFINEKGVLEINGYYPSGDLKLNFSQKYISEGLIWKLIRFQFKVE